MKSVHGLFLATTLVAAAAAFAESDSWDASTPSGVEILLALAKKADAYVIKLAAKPWDGANGAERVEPAIPKDEKVVLARCRGLVAKGERDAAIMAIDEVVKKDPSNWDAFCVRAQSQHAKKADDEAVAALRASLIGNRRNPDAWKLLDAVAEAMGRKVDRPRVELHGWVRDLGRGQTEVGHVTTGELAMPWSYYAAARAYYRGEGPFARDFPAAKTYAFTFREQMYAMNVLAASLADEEKNGAKLPPDLARVLAEKKAGTLAQFTFFAAWPEPLTSTPEPGMDRLRPRLEKYFDERIVVRK